MRRRLARLGGFVGGMGGWSLASFVVGYAVYWRIGGAALNEWVLSHLGASWVPLRGLALLHLPGFLLTLVVVALALSVVWAAVWVAYVLLAIWFEEQDSAE